MHHSNLEDMIIIPLQEKTNDIIYMNSTDKGLPFGISAICQSKEDNNECAKFITGDRVVSLINKYSSKLTKSHDKQIIINMLINEIGELKNELAPNSQFEISSIGISYEKRVDGRKRLFFTGFGVGQAGMQVCSRIEERIHEIKPSRTNYVINSNPGIGSIVNKLWLNQTTKFADENLESDDGEGLQIHENLIQASNQLNEMQQSLFVHIANKKQASEKTIVQSECQSEQNEGIFPQEKDDLIQKREIPTRGLKSKEIRENINFIDGEIRRDDILCFYTGAPEHIKEEIRNDSKEYVLIKNSIDNSIYATKNLTIPDLGTQIDNMKQVNLTDEEKLNLIENKLLLELQNTNSFANSKKLNRVRHDVYSLGIDLCKNTASLTEGSYSSVELSKAISRLNACYLALSTRNDKKVFKTQIKHLQGLIEVDKQEVLFKDKMTGFRMMLQGGCLEVLAVMVTLGSFATLADVGEKLMDYGQSLCSSGLSIFHYGLQRNQVSREPNRQLKKMADFVEEMEGMRMLLK